MIDFRRHSHILVEVSNVQKFLFTGIHGQLKLYEVRGIVSLIQLCTTFAVSSSVAASGGTVYRVCL